MSDDLDDLDDRDEVPRPPPPWGAEITPLTEVCGGQYVLLHEIGRGELSIVYRAKPTGSRDAIAFKLIQPQLAGDEAQVRRFRREAEVLRRIEHPNVVRLLDHGTIEDGRDFVALELLVGRSLAESMAKAQRMSPERTCRIARQVGRALRAMHKAGVIHRDLKPQNILLIGPEDAERVKLIDFSAAGELGAPVRRVKGDRAKSDVHEQPSYRAPEQVRKRPPQPSMDVFALGAIMYEMLAGEHPFAVPKAPKLGAHTIRTKAFDAPEVLLGLVADCIERDPAERPPTMDDVLDRIDKALLWMGVVPHEISPELGGAEADEDRRTQLWTAADEGKTSPVKASPIKASPSKERPSRGGVGTKSKISSRKPVDDDDWSFGEQSFGRGEELELDLIDDEPAPEPAARPAAAPARGRKPWELTGNAPDLAEEDEAESQRARAAAATRSREEASRARAQEEARRAQEEAARQAQDEIRKAQEAARQAREEARRAQEEARRAQEEASRARAQQEEARRAQEARRVQEEARRAEEARRGQEEARRAQEARRVQEEARRAQEARRVQEEARRAQEEARRAQEEARRAQEEARRERSRRDGPSTGSTPRIDLDDLEQRERASRDGPSSGSIPRIDLDDLDEGAPTGPRFVVDTVAWTKQQPSAEPERSRKRRVGADRDDRRPPPSARPGTGAHPPVSPHASSSSSSSSSQRTTGTHAPVGARQAPGSPRVRPPTAAQAPVDGMPRWGFPLVVMILGALAYAVWVVWTQ